MASNINGLVSRARALLEGDTRTGWRATILHEWLDGRTVAARQMVCWKYGPGEVRRALREEAIRHGGYNTDDGSLFFALRESVVKDPNWRRTEAEAVDENTVPSQRPKTGKRSSQGNGARG